MRKQKSGAKRVLKVAGIVLGVIVLVLAIWLGPVIWVAFKSGIAQDLISPPERVEYDAGVAENLEAIHTAMMQYHDSEGGFPPAEEWMDLLLLRLRTADLKEGEEYRKLMNPKLSHLGTDVFGYAYNYDVQNMYIDDIPGGENQILVYETADPAYSISGDPADALPIEGSENLAVTVGGEILPLSEALDRLKETGSGEGAT